MTVRRLIICFLLTLGFTVYSQRDTTITVPREAWHRYFENSSQPNHSAIDDHRSYHNMVIATDRPDQTESPYLVPKGRAQIETGYWVEKDKDQDSIYTNNFFNTTLFKYGLTDHFELRLITEVISEKAVERIAGGKSETRGLNSIAIGSKIFICEEQRFIPKISLITHLQLPYFGKKEFSPNFIAPRFRFLFQHTLSDRFVFSYNLGAEWDGISNNTTLIYTTSLGINLVPNFAMFIEAYGFLSENAGSDNRFDGTFSPDNRFDGGFTYVLTNDFQLDASAGIGLNEKSPDYFLSCGASFRFPKAK